MEREKLTPSQAIKQILDLLEVAGTPPVAVDKVRKLCWAIVDSKAVDNEG